ncbi:hypothetical protein MW385_003542, partial [Acinetobacter baumannii]|nr:hypothetical protein [Acinetobacter baumannii]
MSPNYITNFGIETGNEKYLFLTSHSLDHSFVKKYKDIIDQCHIYCVVDCPRFTFIPETLIYEFSENYIFYTVELKYILNGKEKTVQIKDSFQVPKNTKKAKIDAYPHTDIILMDKNDNFIMSATASGLAYAFKIEDAISLKILYIGKSTGVKKFQNGLERAKSHKTLQKILADRNTKYPDRIVFVGLFNFSEIKLYSNIDFGDLTQGIDWKKEISRLKRSNDFKMTLAEQTSLIEAILIRHFEPEYNITLKNDLPSKNSKTFQKCAQYDITAIAIKFYSQDENPPFYNYLLYTEKVKKSAIHNIFVELNDPNERKGFFTINGVNFAP